MTDRCTWCNHQRHDVACTQTITTRDGKTTTESPCPCTRHTKRTKHTKGE